MANLNIKQVLGRLKTWIEGHFISSSKITLPQNDTVDLSNGLMFEKGAISGIQTVKRNDDGSTYTPPMARYFSAAPKFRALGEGSVVFGEGIAVGQGAVNEGFGPGCSNAEVSITGEGTLYQIDGNIYGQLPGAIIRLVNPNAEGDSDYYCDYCTIISAENPHKFTVDKSIGTLNQAAATINYYSYNDLNNGAVGSFSHSEGMFTTSIGNYSHAEGYQSRASGANSHAEGHQTGAGYSNSHAEGYTTYCYSPSSHAEGHCTIAGFSWDDQTNDLGSHAEGKWNRINLADSTREWTQHTVGIGAGEYNRKNAFEISNLGNVWVYGVSGYDGTNPTTNNTLQHALENSNPNVSDFVNRDYDYILGQLSDGDIRNYYIWVDGFSYATGVEYWAAQNDYEGDVEGYIQALIDGDLDGLDCYHYIDEFEYEGTTYSLMYSEDQDMYALLKSGETVGNNGTLSTKSLAADPSNYFCPFYARLDSDCDVVYIQGDGTIEHKYILVDVNGDYVYVSDFRDDDLAEIITDAGYEYSTEGLESLIEDMIDDPAPFGINRYEYVEDMEYDGETYEMWLGRTYSSNTDRLEENGMIGLLEPGKSYSDLYPHSLESNSSNRWCPFTYIMSSDQSQVYDEHLENNHSLIFLEEAN